MSALNDQVAVVTGASGSIGGAIARALADRGVRLCLVQHVRIPSLSGEGPPGCSSDISVYEADLGMDDDIRRLVAAVNRDHGGCDILVHSAGVISLGVTEEASIESLDHQYRINVRAPYVLSQALLPSLRNRSGQIVFVNSSAGLRAKAGVGQYAATKHALKAFADSLREEVNADGVRVVSVYPGQTAGPMQAALYETAGTTYAPERLLQPADVAEVVVSALSLPRSAELSDVTVRSMQKPSRSGLGNNG